MTAIIWIDWYSYHISRLRALFEQEHLQNNVIGIELVGGCGVHAGLKFRDPQREKLPIVTLFPQTDWAQAGPWKLSRALWKKLDELSPSAVLVPGWYTAPALAAALWCKLNRKRAFLMSETTEHDHPRVWWKEQVKRTFVRPLFDGGVVGGKAHARYLCQLGFNPANLAKFYDVVDNKFFESQVAISKQIPSRRVELGLPQKYFLYVGRLAPEKNLGICLQAFAEYRQRGGVWSLMLIGDGPERAFLECEVDRLHLRGDVLFVGLKTAKELTEYYAFASCFVLPSTREPWGLVVNEAMASGLPVIVSRRSGCAEDLIDPGANGFVFDPFNKDELSARMSQISAMNAATLQAMGLKSRELIQDYSTDNWALEVAQLLKGKEAVPCASYS